MREAGDIDRLERSRRRAAAVLGLSVIALLVCLAFRFVPRLNDALSGKPDYVRIMTESMARQLAVQSHQLVPVLVEQKEDGPWPQVKSPLVPPSELRGILYGLIYSEKQHLTSLTEYAIPADAGKFSNVYTITPGQGKDHYGPGLLRPVRAVPINASIHVYSLEFFKWLHWRFTPHFPLTPSEAVSLASRTYHSDIGTGGGDAGIDFDFDFQELRAEIAKPHDLLNFRLALVLAVTTLLLLWSVLTLRIIYKLACQYGRVYHLDLNPRVFLREDLAAKMGSARRRYFEQQQQSQERTREQEKLHLLRVGWVESLRSALPSLAGEQLRTRIRECLETDTPDLETMKGLWMEIQEQAGQKTPDQRLSLLLESLMPYCTEEESQKCHAEVFAVFSQSGFRAARRLAITLHDQYKARAREMEEMENKAAQEPSQMT